MFCFEARCKLVAAVHAPSKNIGVVAHVFYEQHPVPILRYVLRANMIKHVTGMCWLGQDIRVSGYEDTAPAPHRSQFPVLEEIYLYITSTTYRYKYRYNAPGSRIY